MVSFESSQKSENNNGKFRCSDIPVTMRKGIVGEQEKGARNRVVMCGHSTSMGNSFLRNDNSTWNNTVNVFGISMVSFESSRKTDENNGVIFGCSNIPETKKEEIVGEQKKGARNQVVM
jgi:hypothetical protein